MFRLFLSALAAFVIVRILVGLVQAIAAGLRDGRADSVRGGRPPSGPNVGTGRGGGTSAAGRPPIDRDSAIDVSYTEVEVEESSEPGRERRAG